MSDSHAAAHVDPRIARTRTAVLEATIDQLARYGPTGVSIESVASASGVAKTTIYRHWETRGHLILDAFRWLRLRDVGPETVGDLYRDLHAIVDSLVEGLNSEHWALLFPSMVEAANRDETVHRLLFEVIEQLRSPVRQVLELAQARGEIHQNVDIGVLISEIAGPLFYRRFITREPITRSLARQIADRVLTAVAVKSHVPVNSSKRPAHRKVSFDDGRSKKQ